MRTFVQRSIFVLLGLFAARGDGLRAQWRLVGPHVVTALSYPINGLPELCSMHYSHGVIWAGTTDLAFSRDTGRTWTMRPFGIGRIKDISFTNKSDGVVCGEFGIFQTQDTGSTWISDGSFGQCCRISYFDSGKVIYALNQNPGEVYVSFDGGLTWTTRIVGHYGLSFTRPTDGSLAVLSRPDGTSKDHLFISTDSGVTWQDEDGEVNFDCYSIDVDSCDVSTFYVANEDIVHQGDFPDQIYKSSDNGAQWTPVFSYPTEYLSGAFASSPHAQYAGTERDGVLRSTDHGLTWQRIGGPIMPWDSRNICVINDNIIFVLDTAGNVWATFNSGGDSLQFPGSTFTASPISLFDTDTINCYTDSLTRTIRFSESGCPPPRVESWSISGPDSSSFNVTNFASDSLNVTVRGQQIGQKNALLTLHVDNGLNESILLNGFVKISPVQLSLSSADLSTNTIGGDVSIPITITGLAQPENVDLVLHYDSILQYQGSNDAANAKLDVAGEQWPGRSKLAIAQAQSGVIAGYARFTVFADSDAKPQVTFDSLDILTAVSPCEYTLPLAVTSTITPPTGCGTTILSQFLENGRVPSFSIRPNPTMGDVELTSSLDLGTADVEIYDMLGVKRGDFAVALLKDFPAHLSLPGSAGIYYLRIHSIAGIRSMSVIVAK